MSEPDVKISPEEYRALIALRDECYPVLQAQFEELGRAYTKMTVTLSDVMAVLRRIGGWMPTEDQAACRMADNVLREAGWTPPAIFPERKK